MSKLTLKKRVVVCSVAVAVGVFGLRSTQAQLIAYENFNYTPDTQLFGTAEGAGGVGWSTTWSATSAAIATNSATGLTYSGLPTSGGSVVMGNFGSGTASSQRLVPDNFGTLAAAGSGTLWVSFLFQNLNPDQGGFAGFREAKLGFFANATTNANGSANVNGNERLDVGSPNTYAAGADDTLSLFQGSTYVSSGTATPRGTDPADTVFILLRLDVDNDTGTADTAYAWFNPSLASEPGTGTAIMFNANDLSAVNGLRFQGGGANGSGTNAIFIGDELRVGYTFADMVAVPEPASLGLLAIGAGAMLLALRRKRQ